MPLQDEDARPPRSRRRPAAFAALYDRHERRAYNLCYRITGSADDAADATQETFLKVLERLPSLARPRAQLRRLRDDGRAPRELRRDRAPQARRARPTRSPTRPCRSAPATRPTARARRAARGPPGADPARQREPAGAPARGARAARARGALLRRGRPDHGHEPELGRPADLARAHQPARRAAPDRARLRRRPRRPTATARCRCSRMHQDGLLEDAWLARAPDRLRRLPRAARGDGGGRASPTASGCCSCRRCGCARTSPRRPSASNAGWSGARRRRRALRRRAASRCCCSRSRSDRRRGAVADAHARRAERRDAVVAEPVVAASIAEAVASAARGKPA